MKLPQWLRRKRQAAQIVPMHPDLVIYRLMRIFKFGPSGGAAGLAKQLGEQYRIDYDRCMATTVDILADEQELFG